MRFIVRTETILDADDPLDAARQFRADIANGATCGFQVESTQTGEAFSVDVAALEVTAYNPLDLTKKYMVFNLTDGIPASAFPMTPDAARKFVADFPKNFEGQGFYRTSSGQHIDPYEVQFELREVPDDDMPEPEDFEGTVDEDPLEGF